MSGDPRMEHVQTDKLSQSRDARVVESQSWMRQLGKGQWLAARRLGSAYDIRFFDCTDEIKTVRTNVPTFDS